MEGKGGRAERGAPLARRERDAGYTPRYNAESNNASNGPTGLGVWDEGGPRRTSPRRARAPPLIARATPPPCAAIPVLRFGLGLGASVENEGFGFYGIRFRVVLYVPNSIGRFGI